MSSQVIEFLYGWCEYPGRVVSCHLEKFALQRRHGTHMKAIAYSLGIL